jgi:hypothetical protein
MKNTIAIAGGFVLFLMSGQARAVCPHTDIIMPPPACVSGDELAAYERGYRNGVYIVDYAFNSMGDCTQWNSGDTQDLVMEVKAYFSAISSIDDVDLCRLGGITDAISDRAAEYSSSQCCGTEPTCADRGDWEGPQYADTYCIMAIAAHQPPHELDPCFDPGPYTRGPIVNQCEDDFERHCDFYFTDTARYDVPGCNEYTNNVPPPVCLDAFINYREFICEAL